MIDFSYVVRNYKNSQLFATMWEFLEVYFSKIALHCFKATVEWDDGHLDIEICIKDIEEWIK